MSPVDHARFPDGMGRLSLNFIRTRRHRGSGHEADELGSEADLFDWISQFSPCGHPLEFPDEAMLKSATQLRESTCELIAAARRGKVLDRAVDRSRINRFAQLPPPAALLDTNGLLRWTAPDVTQAVLSLVARDAVDLATTDAIERVRDCFNPDCGAVFRDGSRPGTRRWCDMNTCGNQAKKQRMRSL